MTALFKGWGWKMGACSHGSTSFQARNDSLVCMPTRSGSVLRSVWGVCVCVCVYVCVCVCVCTCAHVHVWYVCGGGVCVRVFERMVINY